MKYLKRKSNLLRNYFNDLCNRLGKKIDKLLGEEDDNFYTDEYPIGDNKK